MVSPSDDPEPARELLQTILEALPIRVFWKDRELRYLGSNQSFAREAGVDSPQALIGKTDLELAWCAQAERFRADDQAVIRTGDQRLGYLELSTAPNGTRVVLRTSKVPLRDAAGAIIGVLGVYEDVTAESAADGRCRALVEQTPLAQQILDLEVVFMSGYAQSMPEELRERSRFLQKPFAVEQLATTVREVLDRA